MSDNYSTGGWNAVWGEHAGYDCMTSGWTFYFTGDDGERREMFTVDEREFCGEKAWDKKEVDPACEAFAQWLLRRLRGG